MTDPQKTASGSAGASAQSAQDGARIAQLEQQVKDLTAQVQKLTELAARAQADLQNAKVRMQKDAQEIRAFAGEMFMKKLLPVVDNFNRAFKQLPKELAANEWVKGITAIEQNLIQQMAEMGLKKMEVLGQQVDTAKHEVLTVGEGKEGEVIEVFEDGYELNGRVLRPAKVRVGGGKAGKA